MPLKLQFALLIIIVNLMFLQIYYLHGFFKLYNIILHLEHWQLFMNVFSK